jgi:dihydroflavonol-4-reductase
MVLVTGGTGFIGSYLLYELLKTNPEIKALKRPGSDLKNTRFIFKYLSESEPMPDSETWEQAFERINWVEGDITDYESIIEALDQVDFIYHAAAIVSFSRKEKGKVLETNVNGTANIVNACLEKGVKNLAYVSSVAALARKEGEKITESSHDDEISFTNAYSESKYRAEMEVWRGMAEGLNVFIINPGIVLGWGNFENSSPEMFKTVDDGLKFYPTGSNAFVDVRDVAKALISLTANEKALNKRFIAAGTICTYKKIFDLMASGLNVNPPKIKVKSGLVTLVWVLAEIKGILTRTDPFITKDMALTSSKNYDFDSSRLKELLDFEFIPIEKTIADTCKVFLSLQTR